MKQKAVRLLVACCCIGMLSGCGQKGFIEIPDEASKEQTMQERQSIVDTNEESEQKRDVDNEEQEGKKEDEGEKENKEIDNDEKKDTKEPAESEKEKGRGNSDENEAKAKEVENQSDDKEQNAAKTEGGGELRTNQDNDEKDNSQKKKIKEGTITEKKDFMFVIEDSEKAAYLFAFDEKPDGYDDLSLGDDVRVEYSGELSQVDAFKGKVFSVEKIKKKGDGKKK